MKKAGRPANPFKTNIEPISGYTDDRDDKDREDFQDHEIDDAMHTIGKAEAMKKNPNLMAKVHQASGKKIMGLKSLKALAGKKALKGL